MIRPLRALLSTCLALILVAGWSWTDVSARVKLDRFDLQAHRGGRDLYPENTLAAFRNALRMGVTTLEMDLGVTKDGVVVVSHNPRLSGEIVKDPQGNWIAKGQEPAVHHMTLAQLKQYETPGINPGCGEYFQAHGAIQKTVPGERIPTLDEVFRLVESVHNDRVLFNIETKSFANLPDGELNPSPYHFVKAVLDVVRQHHMENRVMIQSFDWRTLLEVRRADRNITTVALTSEVHEWGDDGLYRHVGKPGCSPWMAGFDIDDFGGNYVRAAKAIHADVVSPYYKELTPRLVDEAHRLGMKVVPWTVNKREDMVRLVDMGVDGIISDRPDLLKQLLMERNIAF